MLLVPVLLNFVLPPRYKKIVPRIQSIENSIHVSITKKPEKALNN